MPYATVSKRFAFDAAHHLPTVPEGHKCRRMHGHTYRVELVFQGYIDEMGFVLDYARIEEAWAPMQELLDHTVLNDIPGLEVPTTENLLVWLWRRLGPVWSPTTQLGTGDVNRAPSLEVIRIFEASTTWCEMDRAASRPW